MFFTRLLCANQMPIFLFQFLKAFLMCIPLKNSLVMLDCVHFYLRSTGAKLNIAVIMSTFLYILPILLSLFKNAQWCDVQPSLLRNACHVWVGGSGWGDKQIVMLTANVCHVKGLSCAVTYVCLYTAPLSLLAKSLYRYIKTNSSFKPSPTCAYCSYCCDTCTIYSIQCAMWIALCEMAQTAARLRASCLFVAGQNRHVVNWTLRAVQMALTEVVICSVAQISFIALHVATVSEKPEEKS